MGNPSPLTYSLLPAPEVHPSPLPAFCRFSLPFLLPSRSDRTKRSYFFPLLVAVSIAASGCRFSLPFGKAKSLSSILLSDEKGFTDWGIEGSRD